MSWRPGGAASLRLEAEGGLESRERQLDPHLHTSPPRLLPFALAGAGICALSGLGVLPWPAVLALDLGSATCYGLALRASLPRWPDGPQGRLALLNGMAPALLPLAGLVSADLALPQRPGLPWVVLLPLWLLVLLGLAPFLAVGQEHGYARRWESTLLAVLAISVPVPIFALVMAPTVAGPLRGLGVLAVLLVPTWQLASLVRPWRQAWRRAALVAVLVGAAAGASAWLQVPAALLPAAMLLGWYGLAGVVSQRDGQYSSSFAAFVVAAAVLLAVTGPV
ncbi:MAG: hypothetical protein ACREN4_02075 [Candidatus Dormibacteria bacterium]